jgi:hypothetical protein
MTITDDGPGITPRRDRGRPVGPATVGIADMAAEAAACGASLDVGAGGAAGTGTSGLVPLRVRRTVEADR